eukprot:14761238-Alexandrium_andersonii.AAC.1
MHAPPIYFLRVARGRHTLREHMSLLWRPQHGPRRRPATRKLPQKRRACCGGVGLEGPVGENDRMARGLRQGIDVDCIVLVLALQHVGMLENAPRAAMTELLEKVLSKCAVLHTMERILGGACGREVRKDPFQELKHIFGHVREAHSSQRPRNVLAKSPLQQGAAGGNLLPR